MKIEKYSFPESGSKPTGTTNGPCVKPQTVSGALCSVPNLEEFQDRNMRPTSMVYNP